MKDKEIEDALRGMAETRQAIDSAFQRNKAIGAAARELARRDWPTIAPKFGFGRTLVGADAARAFERMAARYNASVVRSPAFTSPLLGAFRVAENLQKSILDLSKFGEQRRTTLMEPMRAYQDQ